MKNKNLWVDNQPLSLFAQDKGAFYYEERAILLANPGDIVIVDFEIEKNYLYQLKKMADYSLVNLICLKNRHNDLVESIQKWNQINLLREFVCKNNYVMRSYIPDERIRILSHDLKIKAIGINFYADNRRQSDLIMLLNDLNFHVIETLFLKKSSVEEIEKFFIKNQHVLCKPNESIGGKEIIAIKNAIELKEIYKLNNSKIEYVLQKKIKADLEGSIQFIYENGKFGIYVCETFNPHNRFQGFSYPCKTELSFRLQDDAEKVLKLFTKKYKSDIDSFGIDFIISDNKVYYHDLNPRKTAVSYILRFLKKAYLNFNQFENFKVVCLYFQINTKLTYNELQKIFAVAMIPNIVEQGEGIMIINPGTIKIGIIQIVSVSFLSKEKEYLEKIRRLLKQKGVDVQWPNTVIQ